MVENVIYLATEEVVKRAGVYETAYMVADGRFIIDNKDIRRIRLTGEEYLTGIAGIERITEHEAELLISENGYRRSGDAVPESTQQPAEPSLSSSSDGGTEELQESSSSDGGSEEQYTDDPSSSDEGSSSSDTDTNQEEE